MKKIVYRLILTLFALLLVSPIVFTISNSFMSEAEIYTNYGAILGLTNDKGNIPIANKINLHFIPEEVSFSQYEMVLLKSPEYLIKFWNSVIYVAPIVFFQLAAATLAAYGFARSRGRVKEIIFFTYIIVMLMPYQVTLVPNYIVADWLNILNTRWAIWLPGIFSPFAVYIITNYMKRIPVSLLEAAQLDGANEWQIFHQVCYPLCKGIIVSAGLLIFFDYWNMVEQPIVLLMDEFLYPLSVYLSKINNGEIGISFAVATIYMIPGILIFLYGEEDLIEGITYQGGVKG